METTFVSFRSRIALIAIVLTSLCASQIACDHNQQDQYGADQGKTVKDKQFQNRTLIDQVVSTAENQDNFPDLSYLSSTLGRLNPWLQTRQEMKDVETDPEYDALSKEIVTLIEASKRANELVSLFTDDAKTPEAKNCEELQDVLKTCETQLHKLAIALKANVLVSFERFVADVEEKLETAREFQFADPVEIFRTQLRQVAAQESYALFNFSTLTEGLTDYNRLLKIDEKIFLPQDSEFLRGQIWLRDAFSWGKGSKQDDMEIVKRLFDWTIKNVVFSNREIGPTGPIEPLVWQTLLLGQGSPMDRAIVFIELLRQHRLDAFVLRPQNDNSEDGSAFPLVVGVRLEGETYLFSPELGLPFVANDSDALVVDGGLNVQKIATLSQVAKDDSILRKFDLPDLPYNAKAEDFVNMTAFVPSTPFLCAARMNPLEQEFSGKVNTVLSTPYASQRERILELDGIADVQRLHEADAPILEHVLFPFESEILTAIYMTPLEQSDNLEVSASTDRTENPDATKVENYTGSKAFSGNASGARKAAIAPLWIGKIKYIRGDFVDENGATTWFLHGRISDRALRLEESNAQKTVLARLNEFTEARAQTGAQPTEEELQRYANETMSALRFDIATKRFLKVVTSYYLALLSDASGNESATMDRLVDESLRVTNANESYANDFKRAATYLRARILESEGSFPAAIANYRNTNERGSIVRAKWLADLTGNKLDLAPDQETTSEKTDAEASAETNASEQPADETVEETTPPQPEPQTADQTEESPNSNDLPDQNQATDEEPSNAEENPAQSEDAQNGGAE